MTKDEVTATRTRFEAWRKIDPAMNRVVVFAASNVDGEGSTWTDHGRPAKVVAGRLVGLAKAAIEHVPEQGAQLDAEVLFESSLADYDFVIHLDPKVLGKTSKKSSKPAYKNLELQQANSGGVDDFTLASGSVGFAPAKLFLEDLERRFGQAVVFFAYDDVIAGLWNPTCEKRAWKLSLGYSSVPAKGDGEKEVYQAKLNKSGIVAEIARLGGDMVEKIEVVEK
jgi:U3 small nucleolar RNA-associated protein 22